MRKERAGEGRNVKEKRAGKGAVRATALPKLSQPLPCMWALVQIVPLGGRHKPFDLSIVLIQILPLPACTIKPKGEKTHRGFCQPVWKLGNIETPECHSEPIRTHDDYGLLVGYAEDFLFWKLFV